MCVASVSVALPQLLAGALPVTKTQKFVDRLCRLHIYWLLGRHSAVAQAYEGDDALSTPSLPEEDAERGFLKGRGLQ